MGYTLTVWALFPAFSLLWTVIFLYSGSVGQARPFLGGCYTQVHHEMIWSQFHNFCVDHLLLSGQWREGAIKALIKPNRSFIFRSPHIATVNFHLLQWDALHLLLSNAVWLWDVILKSGERGFLGLLFSGKNQQHNTELERIDAYSVFPLHAWLISAEVAKSVYLERALIPVVTVWLQLWPFAASHMLLHFSPLVSVDICWRKCNAGTFAKVFHFHIKCFKVHTIGW